MKLQEVRSIARKYNVKSTGLSHAELVRSIQRNEGNYDCFGSPGHGECDQDECLWREDCLLPSEE